MAEKNSNLKILNGFKILNLFCVLMARQLLLCKRFEVVEKIIFDYFSKYIPQAVQNVLSMGRYTQNSIDVKQLEQLKTLKESPRLSMRRPVISSQQTAVNWLMSYTLALRHAKEFWEKISMWNLMISNLFRNWTTRPSFLWPRRLIATIVFIGIKQIPISQRRLSIWGQKNW